MVYNRSEKKNKYPRNSNPESDVYDYSVIPEQKSKTCSVRTGNHKIKIKVKRTRSHLLLLLYTITMFYCILKICNFLIKKLDIFSNCKILK